MNRINLTGLRADLPISAMAAFGMLRVCSQSKAGQSTTLAWRNSGSGFHAVLQSADALSSEDLISVLFSSLKDSVNQPVLTWSEQLKSVKIDDFVNVSRKAAKESTSRNRESADWVASFGNELTPNEDKIETTPFDMSVARQKFPADAIRLGISLINDENSTGRFHEALFGPWKYTDDQHSFGWDPTTIKMGAFTHKAPTGMANAGVSAAVWLAFQSLPLFPCFYSAGPSTRSLKPGRQPILCWPIWNGAIGLSELTSLLSWKGILDDEISVTEAEGRGILAIYRSARFKPNKYLASFRPPELVYSAADGTK